MHNLLIADDLTVTDGVICPPPTVRPADLGALLDVVAERLEPEGLLALAGSWGDYLKPYAALPGDQRTDVTAGDWSARLVPGDVWIRWKRTDGRPLWTLEHDAAELGDRSAPLLRENPMETGLLLGWWRRATGHTWAGSPGMAGNAMLVNGWSKGEAPRWNGGLGGDTWGPSELPYLPGDWSTDAPAGHVVHGYDLNRAYLSALGVLEVASDRLEFRGTPHEFDPKRGGMWRVELSPWLGGDQLPDPAGYGHALPDGTRWLTTQTLVLLQQLTDADRYGGFSVRQSYTAPARRLFREWAGRLQAVITAPAPGEAQRAAAVAAKKVYQQTYGMWQRGGLVRRPDWYAATIAMARANLWRQMDRARKECGLVPLHVDTDCVYYSAPQGTTWADAAPATFKLDPAKAGHFKEHA